MSKFTDMQQRVIDDDMRTMSPETVNQILTDMKPDEANHFLEKLGHLRSSDIYDREENDNGQVPVRSHNRPRPSRRV